MHKLNWNFLFPYIWIKNFWKQICIFINHYGYIVKNKIITFNFFIKKNFLYIFNFLFSNQLNFKIWTNIYFINAILLSCVFTAIIYKYDFSPTASTLQFSFSLLNFSNIGNLNFAINGLGLFLCCLTIVIMPICMYITFYTINNNKKEFLQALLLIEYLLLFTFCSSNLFFFYIFFESILVPMFLMIGIWGSRHRKIKAVYYFFFFTLIGSLFMLFGIMYLIIIVHSVDFAALEKFSFSLNQQIFLFIAFFIPFAVKIPMFPFHIWLPEAHVEAPTIGSIILASLLLKLGSYGLLKITIPFFWLGAYFFAIPVDLLALISVFYASLITIRQIDMKRIIAYSSIAHMNLMVLGIFSFNLTSIEGAIYLMLGHGIVSSALFFCVGCLYDKYHTRLLKYFGGLATVMPHFCFFFFVFSLANIGFPGTSNFIGEFMIFLGILSKNSFILFFSGFSVVLSSIYSMWLFNRICFGPLKTNYVTQYSDLITKENRILSIFTIIMFILGIKTKYVFLLTHSYIYAIVQFNLF